MKASETIDYKLALFIYKCRQGAAPLYLADELSEPCSAFRGTTSTTLRLVVVASHPSAIELFWLLRPVSGTVYRSTSHPRSHFQSPAVALRHISTGAASRDYVIAPEKLHCHFSEILIIFLTYLPLYLLTNTSPRSQLLSTAAVKHRKTQRFTALAADATLHQVACVMQ